MGETFVCLMQMTDLLHLVVVAVVVMVVAMGMVFQTVVAVEEVAVGDASFSLMCFLVMLSCV